MVREYHVWFTSSTSATYWTKSCPSPAVGEEDPFCQNTRELSDRLRQKAVPHHLHIWSGEAHRPRYWREMVNYYL